MATRLSVLSTATVLALFAAGCTVGPKYHTPSVQTPPAYKEASVPAPATTSAAPAAQPNAGASAPSVSGTVPLAPAQSVPFRLAQPSDSMLRGKWWEMFNDPELNTLEEQVNISNQTIAAATASYFTARALVREARSQFFPVATSGVSISRQRGASAGSSGGGNVPGSTASFSDPFNASWEPDLWGRVRNQVAANAAAAQVSAADLENTRLSIHSELAIDYFELRGQDNLKKLLDSTVAAYRQSLELTKALYETGIDSDEAVAQAETQLESAVAEDMNIDIQRAALEHAIAVLVGQPPSTFDVQPLAGQPAPPTIPVSAPSDLLERRPDIAAAERVMAQANAEIGIATAAYYPNVTLTASAGFSVNKIADWFTWSSRVWSIGGSLSETLFDAGLRKATVQQFRGVFDQSVANYRQTVLSAFQQVEDNLAAQRVLSAEVQQQATAVNSAQRNLNLATERYQLGIDPYLNVITAETTFLNNQQTAVNLQTEQMTSSVSLIEALGGGWDVSQLPSASAVASVSMPATPQSSAPAAAPTVTTAPATR